MEIKPTTTAQLDTMKKGDTFTNGDGSTGIVKFDYKTGKELSDPVTSSTKTRSAYSALDKDISSYTGDAKLTSLNDANTELINDRMDQLRADYQEDISGIKSSYKEADRQQGERQTKDYAGRSTSLVTSGGGFLGATQSHEGVLQNLKGTFANEKTALMAKRDAALQAARSAYNDKSFTLAAAKLQQAKDTEKEIYTRQNDFAEQQLALSRENRAQTEFEDKRITEQLKSFAEMTISDPAAKLDPELIKKIDDYYGISGYAQNYLQVARAAALGKTVESDLDMKNKLQTLINKTPQGQKITLPDGTVYMGMKKPPSASTSGLIPGTIASQLGVPSLAGKDESDVILSLSFQNPPQWYKEYHKSSGLDDSQVQTDWTIFKGLPDIEAYKNSSVVSKRIEVSGSILDDLNVSDDDISALDE